MWESLSHKKNFMTILNHLQNSHRFTTSIVPLRNKTDLNSYIIECGACAIQKLHTSFVLIKISYQDDNVNIYLPYTYYYYIFNIK